MRPDRLLIPTLLLGSVLGSASGAEIQISDLRLFGGVTPTDVDTDVEFDSSAIGSASESDSSDLDERTRVELSYVRSLFAVPVASPSGGFIFGGAVAYDQFDDDDTEAETWILSGMAGWAWALLPSFHIEGGLLFGIGNTSLEMDVGEEDSSTYEYGIRAGAYYTFSGGWQLGADLRYLVTTLDQVEFEDVDLDGDAAADTVEMEAELAGLAALIGVGYRF